ncbi:MAG: hypothetical protein KGL39_06470 [Patescibacteria group bacterium]|nr:hypothetical protein [Patescibacteria group bacterium]
MDSDKKIVSLRGETVVPRGRNEDVVKELRRALEMAECGEIDGVFIVYVYADDCTSGLFCGKGGRGMLGMVECLKDDLIKEAK